MDHERRIASDSLTLRLHDKPYEFDFFQAVRRLECARPDLPRVGYSQRPHADPVRFSQDVSLSFAPSSVKAYHEATSEHPARMIVSFLGLLGTNGPMPLAITEYVHDRLHNHRDRTLASFLDIFNHRMISLFYRAWACNRQGVSYDRKEENRFALYIGGLFGIGADSLRNRDAVPDPAKLHYSGRLACPAKYAEGLREILQDYFGITVKIDEFVGQWINLPKEYRCQLGKAPGNSKLGRTLVIGRRFWECQQRFRITFGPMCLSDYLRFLPGHDSIRRLIAWVRNYVGDQLSWELQLILRAADVPRIRLGETGQLGWSSWLRSKEFKKDADSLVLRNLVA
ncbi:MAG TPA: type VI secretion system baseplate subunit TssG [Sedimentisphaerales bacterium]|nr:type VI secretion system baseplate subunit TssG [Sedimentisphaerales bacterium]